MRRILGLTDTSPPPPPGVSASWQRQRPGHVARREGAQNAMIWMICSLIGIERTPEQNGGSGREISPIVRH